ncbi:MAG: hypothetical protein KDG50_15285 [Chromatiales bacterium]|nr:hypothetical protein [Chromatiales bacterium]
MTDPTDYTTEYFRDPADRLSRLELPGTGSIT